MNNATPPGNLVIPSGYFFEPGNPCGVSEDVQDVRFAFATRPLAHFTSLSIDWTTWSTNPIRKENVRAATFFRVISANCQLPDKSSATHNRPTTYSEVKSVYLYLCDDNDFPSSFSVSFRFAYDVPTRHDSRIQSCRIFIPGWHSVLLQTLIL